MSVSNCFGAFSNLCKGKPIWQNFILKSSLEEEFLFIASSLPYYLMKEESLIAILKIFTLIFLLFFSLLPFIYMLMVSLNGKPHFLLSSVPFQFTLENYFSIVEDKSLHFLNYLFNSIIVSFFASLLGVTIATLAGYAFSRLPFFAKKETLFFLLTLSMFPQISMVSYLFQLMNAWGWINTYQALIFPYTAWLLPICVWVLTSYFSQIPKELDKAALIDGCSHLQVLKKVILPLAVPGVFSTFLLAFIFSFNEFMFALWLTTDFKARTIPVGIALFQGLHGQIPWGTIMAASVIAILPLLAITVIFQKQIISGLTQGAIKG